jgi:hypothetical protein
VTLGDHDARVRAAADARLAFWRTLGLAGDDVLAPLVGPALLAGTRWPTRPAWRTITRDARTAIASDALSDPWDTERGIGFGLELWIETDAAIGVVIGSWLLAAVQEVSYTCAGHGGVRKLVDELGTISVEISGVAFPPELHNQHGRVGVLLGVPTDDVPGWITLPEGRARLVPLTVLTRAELDHITVRGVDGRNEVARALAASAGGFRSRLDRASAI